MEYKAATVKLAGFGGTTVHNAIIYLAGLQDISRELYEAAKIDGANSWQQFRNVTLPGLRPVLLFVLTVIMYIADTGLRNSRQGMAAAMSFILAFALLLVSVANFRLFRNNEQEG